uniref:Ig-like domain-containing protein n=1 Tax=Anser brachyrhynchus TaxID=132585 RepID=A0A8B9C4G1_9AVES
MELCGTAASSVRAVFMVLQLGLTHIMAHQQQIGVEGKEVILNCKRHDKDVIWKYKYDAVSPATIIQLSTGKVFKGRTPMSDRSEINQNSKHLKVSNLRISDAGTYICECGSDSNSISLHVVKLTISSNGHFLPDDDLELTLTHNSHNPQPRFSITLFNSHNSIVTPDILQNEAPQKYVLKLKQLKTTDSGTWMCNMHSDSPSISQNISFNVKVLGFENTHLERMYAAADSTVTLSWHLNFQKIGWKKFFTGQLNWTQSKAVTLLDFNATADGQLRETKKSSQALFEIPEMQRDSTVKVKLPKIQLRHSGEYTCQLLYNRRYIQSKTELVVMQVSANPPGPLPKGAEMTLLCRVSSPIPSNVHLLWERVNGTQTDIKKSKQSETEVEVKVTAAGMWNCHLMEDNNMKLSLNYTVEEAPVWISYTVIGVIIGAGVLMFVLVCLGIMFGMSWQRRRQRAKRMARARQHLLEKKTCQCQHRMNK